MSKQGDWQKFCIEYRKCGIGKKAAIEAGYSPRTAEVKASQLLRTIKVKEYLAELSKDANRKRAIQKRKDVLEIAERQAILSKVATAEDVNEFAKIKAIDTLNRMDGLYVNKVDVQVTGNIAARLKERISRYE